MDPEEEQTATEEMQEQPEGGTSAGPEPSPLRDLVVKAYPDVVPELLHGESVEEMLASVPVAQAAYQRIVQETRPAAPEPVPSGGGASRAFPMDVGAMSPALKIREGLRRVG